MKRKALFWVIILSVLACLTISSVALASSYWQYNSRTYYHAFNHSWGIGWVYRGDNWYEYWDEGQGRYTWYRIDPSSYGDVYVDPSSPGYIYGVYACLIRSDGTERILNLPDVHVYQGQYFHYHWPPTQDVFAKPANPNNDPSQLIWRYQWPGAVYPTTKYNWTEFWYATRSYYYGFWP